LADGNAGADGYAGDITPQEAWDMLENDKDAVLVDVRTDAEWSYVGITDLSAIGKETQFIAWKVFPSMDVNPGFVAGVEAVSPNKDAPVLSICRSGVRSISSSKALTEAGFTKAYNVTEGFEGDKDPSDHRGSVGGWKVRGLPWRQG